MAAGKSAEYAAYSIWYRRLEQMPMLCAAQALRDAEPRPTAWAYRLVSRFVARDDTRSQQVRETPWVSRLGELTAESGFAAAALMGRARHATDGIYSRFLEPG